jgi:hypothetical protein
MKQLRAQYNLSNLSLRQRSDFENGKLTVYVFGIINYTDTFTRNKYAGKTRSTQFCSYWNHKEQKWYNCPDAYISAE